MYWARPFCLTFTFLVNMCIVSVEADHHSDDVANIVSESSKREYLLAQIRQKDAIIESLLKQVS